MLYRVNRDKISNIGILECATLIRKLAQKIAKEKGIKEQEAWNDAVSVYKQKYRYLV